MFNQDLNVHDLVPMPPFAGRWEGAGGGYAFALCLVGIDGKLLVWVGKTIVSQQFQTFLFGHTDTVGVPIKKTLQRYEHHFFFVSSKTRLFNYFNDFVALCFRSNVFRCFYQSGGTYFSAGGCGLQSECNDQCSYQNVLPFLFVGSAGGFT